MTKIVKSVGTIYRIEQVPWCHGFPELVSSPLCGAWTPTGLSSPRTLVSMSRTHSAQRRPCSFCRRTLSDYLVCSKLSSAGYKVITHQGRKEDAVQKIEESVVEDVIDITLSLSLHGLNLAEKPAAVYQG